MYNTCNYATGTLRPVDIFHRLINIHGCYVRIRIWIVRSSDFILRNYILRGGRLAAWSPVIELESVRNVIISIKAGPSRTSSVDTKTVTTGQTRTDLPAFPVFVCMQTAASDRQVLELR